MQTKMDSSGSFVPAPAVVRLRRILFALSLCLAATHAPAQTREWTSGSSGLWTETSRWSGATFAGDAPNASLTGEGTTNDVAKLNPAATVSININTDTLQANDGVGLSLGGIWNVSGTSTIQLDPAATTNGILQLNGATITGANNTFADCVFYQENTASPATGNPTIIGTNANGKTLGVRLATPNRAVFNIRNNRTLLISAAVDEANPGRGFYKTGAGTLVLDASNTISGTNMINFGRLSLLNSNALGSAVFQFGNNETNNKVNDVILQVGASIVVTNTLYVPAITNTYAKYVQASAVGLDASFSGRIIVETNNFQIAASQTTGNLRISNPNVAAPNTIAANVSVLFRMNAGQNLTDSAVWAGDGSINYTRTGGAGGGSLFVSGQKTHTGGTRIYDLLGTSANGTVVVSANSQGPAGAPTSGPFGTGPLTLNSNCWLRADTTQAADVTIGNPLNLASSLKFPTTSGEYSLIFTGPGTMTNDCTLTVDVGTTVAAKSVQFNGAIGQDVTRSLTKAGTGTLKLGGVNTYTGNTIVNGGALELSAGGQLKFVITGNGVNNQINGNSTGTNNLNGSFNLDLTGANTTLGNAWTLVNMATVTTTFGGTFALTSTSGSFTEAANVHTLNIGGGKALSFSEATGVLTVVSAGPSGPGTLTNSVSGSTLTLTWPAGQSWRLVGQTNSLSTGLNPATNAWFTVPGGVDGSNSITINPANPTVFFRLVYP